MTFAEVTTDCWCTPESPVLERVRLHGPIMLDPFHDPSSTVGAVRTIDVRSGGDGFADGWGELSMGQVFSNSPYSGDHPALCAAKIAREFSTNPDAQIWNLCPFAAGSEYWRTYVWPWVSLVICLGRLPFVAGRDMLDDKGRVVVPKGQLAKGNRHEIALCLYTSDASHVRAARSIWSDYPVIKLA